MKMPNSNKLSMLLCFVFLLFSGARASAQYCIPDFINGCISDGDDINTFTLTGASSTAINDLNTGCGIMGGSAGYDDRTSESITLMQGGTYNGMINSEFTSGENAEIFIDFNNNFVFDASESV